MKILHFSQVYPPATGGGGQLAFFGWAKGLVRRGHSVYVVTQRIVGTPDFEVLDGVRVFRVGRALRYRGVLPTGVLPNLTYFTSAFLKGFQLAAAERIDVIHSNAYLPTLVARPVAALARRPHVMTIHQRYLTSSVEVLASWRSQAGVGTVAKLVSPLAERLMLRLPATMVHTVSENSMRDIRAVRPTGRIVVIPPCLDSGEFPTGGTGGGRQVIFIGRLVFHKNLETALIAMKEVARRLPGSHLVVVGDGPYAAKLREFAKANGVEDVVKFTGLLSERDKMATCARSSVLIQPSISEGFGISVLEGFASSLPVVASDVPPLTELVEDGENGICVPPHDEGAWARGIEKLLTDRELSKEFGAKGRAKVEARFSTERVAEMLEAVYLDCLRRAGG